MSSRSQKMSSCANNLSNAMDLDVDDAARRRHLRQCVGERIQEQEQPKLERDVHEFLKVPCPPR